MKKASTVWTYYQPNAKSHAIKKPEGSSRSIKFSKRVNYLVKYYFKSPWISKMIRDFFDSSKLIWENCINRWNVFILLENLKNWIQLSEQEVNHVFKTFTLLLFESGVRFTSNNVIELISKEVKSQTTKNQTWAWTYFKKLSLKKIKTFRCFHYVHWHMILQRNVTEKFEKKLMFIEKSNSLSQVI